MYLLSRNFIRTLINGSSIVPNYCCHQVVEENKTNLGGPTMSAQALIRAGDEVQECPTYHHRVTKV